VLVLSHDVFNDRSGTVIAVALSSQEPRAGFPLTLESDASGLPKRSWIRISQIRTLSVDVWRAHPRRSLIVSSKASTRSSAETPPQAARRSTASKV